MKYGLLFAALLTALAFWNLFAAFIFYVGYEVFNYYADGLPLERAILWWLGTAFSLASAGLCFVALRWRVFSYFAAFLMAVTVSGLVWFAIGNGGNTGIAPPYDMALGVTAFFTMLFAIYVSRPPLSRNDSREVLSNG